MKFYRLDDRRLLSRNLMHLIAIPGISASKFKEKKFKAMKFKINYYKLKKRASETRGAKIN